MIVIAGATATGKTELGIRVAEQINGEIVSADSMQIYRYMNIGTAKPSINDLARVKHYMIDILEPNAVYSVAEYKKQATDIILDIVNRGKVPIIVGGTGLYVNSLLYDYSPFKSDNRLKEELRHEFEEKGADFIYEKLISIDPESAKTIHKNNVKRVLRAIEVKILTGKSIVGKKDRESSIPALVYISDYDREILYEKINFRVDEMFENGLLSEISNLIEQKKLNFNCQSMQAIGYKEFKGYFEKEKTIEEVREIIKQHTRNFAKRQITWFKALETSIWLKNQNIEEKTNRIVGDYYNYFCKLNRGL